MPRILCQTRVNNSFPKIVLHLHVAGGKYSKSSTSRKKFKSVIGKRRKLTTVKSIVLSIMPQHTRKQTIIYSTTNASKLLASTTQKNDHDSNINHLNKFLLFFIL